MERESRVRDKSRRCMIGCQVSTFQVSGSRLKSWKVDDGQVLQPSYETDEASLSIDKTLLLGSDALAEHVIGPALVGNHDRDEDQGNDGHDRQSIL